MNIEVKVPAVGESVTSGIISEWLKKSGSYVESGEVLFVLETDKVSSEIVAEKAGLLTTKADEGAAVKIGEIVAIIDTTAAKPAGGAAPEAPKDSAPAAATHASDAPVKTSPAARRLIEESGVEPGTVPQTSPGRVSKQDVATFLTSKSEAPSAPPAQAAAPAAPTVPLGQRETRRKLSPLRRKIASQLVSAQQTAAILTTFNECDMSAVMALRKRTQDAFTKRHGVKLGFMSFFIKAVVESLKAVPAINSRMDGDDHVQNSYFDIGVAVGTEKGLVVPVVRDADAKNFADLEKELSAAAQKARDGKLRIEDLQGGVFTISNGGIYGSLLSTPILNPPQSGILGMHTIQERPVARDGEVVIRPMMYLALSYDHRVVDGKEAVTFLIRVKDCIEDPTRLLLDL